MPGSSCHIYSLEVQRIVCLGHGGKGRARELEVTKAWIVACGATIWRFTNPVTSTSVTRDSVCRHQLGQYTMA
jgi:hypothetical protein